MIENTADDTEVFAAEGSAVREEFGLADKRVVLYTGTFEAYQGLDLLIEAYKRAAAQSESVHLVMVGGRPAQVDEMRTQIESLQLTDRVTLVGTVHPSRIPSFLEAADVIVSPRASGTNTPLKIYGYLRSGVSVLATNIFSHTQALNDDIALLVPPTAEGLEQGILKLTSDDGLRAKISTAAKAHADAHYSDQTYVNKVTSFYRMVFPDNMVMTGSGAGATAYVGN